MAVEVLLNDVRSEQYRYLLARLVEKYRYHLARSVEQIEIALAHTISTNLHVFPVLHGDF